jgi:enoyl-CoA hydratase/carnithine racemase
LRLADARIALQNGLQDLRLLSELQRFLLNKNLPLRHGGTEKIASQPNVVCFDLKRERDCAILQLVSSDGTNKLTRGCIAALQEAVQQLSAEANASAIKALVITGNEKFFSAGADLNEISRLTGPDAFEFSRAGQALMLAVDQFPVLVIAVIRGYCMGGGMDLALACDYRMAAPSAVFGHRGTTLGVMTGWGGTQRLPRLIGKSRALQMFLLAEMVKADEALRIGLVDKVAEDPISKAMAFAAASQRMR